MLFITDKVVINVITPVTTDVQGQQIGSLSHHEDNVQTAAGVLT